MEVSSEKKHHKRVSGAKANKEKRKKYDELKRLSKSSEVSAEIRVRAQKQLENQRKHNVKAFGVKSYGKATRMIQRKLDRGHKREKILEVNRENRTEPPPSIVVVVGPRGCGKTTLIQCLVKKWTNQKMTSVTGPITVVTSKKRRVTLFECPPDDVNAMIDLAKIADLVLIMIDAEKGFEMETFEFLNILQVHGFPKVIGVLTHLDGFRSAKKLQKTKKTLKQRFWTEIYQGAKLFYLSGLIHGQYPKNEVHNLSLFISRVKFRPLRWRNTHPYVLVDRYEDVTNPALIESNPLVNREIVAFGYMRGSNLRLNSKIHIPGAGDFSLTALGSVSDPCPLPDTSGQSGGRRSLNAKEIRLYAPMSNMGNVTYDQDAVYINVPKLQFTRQEEEEEEEEEDEEDVQRNQRQQQQQVSEGVGIVHQLQDVSVGIDEKLSSASLQLLRGVKLRRSKTEESKKIEEEKKLELVQEEEESELDEEDRLVPIVKDSGGQTNLMQLVYGKPNQDNDSDSSMSSDSDDDDGDNFFRPKQKRNENDSDDEDDENDSSSDSDSDSEKEEQEQIVEDVIDCSRVYLKRSRWNDESIESLRERFVTGSWGKTNGHEEEEGTFEMLDEDVEEEEQQGTFEMVNGEDETDSSDDDDDEEEEEQKQPAQDKSWREERDRRRAEERERIRAEKAAAKKKFNEEYDEEKNEEDEEDELLAAARREMDAQQNLNETEFADLDVEERERIEGVKSGMYVRVKLSAVPCEFVKYFDKTKPLLLGGLLPHEMVMGLIQMRIKAHRWFPKRLKCNDPLIFSIGWRRFQSLPLLSTKDQNSRVRMIKYTPEHLHCLATVYGPMVPPNTGVLAIQTLNSTDSARAKFFSIAATGVVIEVDRSFKVVKKLKLVGYPQKVFKKTAFIKDMFHSDMEVSKFEGAKLRTVSGIRGAIKKAQGSDGIFRATFEDKILRSDIVFCNTWVGVEPKRLYNPVCNHLVEKCVQTQGRDEENEDESKWIGMRTTGQLRHAKEMKVPVNPDSFYRDIERQPRVFNPLRIPKSLQAALPFSSKPKVAQKGKTAMKRKKKKKKSVLSKLRRAVVMNKEEKRSHVAMQQMRTISRATQKKRDTIRKKKRAEYLKRKAIDEAGRSAANKAKKKRKYKMEGLLKLKRDRAAAGR